ncbi:MAG: extracellular solute-binding protein [Rhodospirillales bacterium]|nr:extracellular solute-binding protein [Rhodospirillales bacterium]
MKNTFTKFTAALALATMAVFSAATGTAQAAEKFITVASTTSTQNSGLYDFMLPIFTKKTGIQVRVVAVGTGQAIRLARAGDADVLFVHHKPSEIKFVADGFGVKRTDVMYNDFVIIGPKADPAGVKGMKTAAGALAVLAKKKTPFASRGDNSGTNKAELGLWKISGIDPKTASGSWYRETGSGMGATLNTAAAMPAYTLSDRATWLKFKNKGDLRILVEGDEKLFNQYGIILINPKKHPQVKAKLGQAFIDWVLSPEGQGVIHSYKIKGQQAFFPNAPKGGS